MGSKEGLISVIVPIYNAEKYIGKCISSIISQTYNKLEIILVDDGSTDKTGFICEEFKAIDSRIVVVHKENGGQASARNLGMDLAKGEYFGFVDADDWIRACFFEELINLMINYSADISCCNFEVVFDDVAKNHSWNPEDGQIVSFSNHEAMLEILKNKRINEMFWNKLFKRKTIEKERFIEGMIFEDTEMMHRCLSKANTVVYSSQPLYYNYMSSGSTTRSKVSPKMYDRITANEKRIDFYKQHYSDMLPEANGSYAKACLDFIDISTGNEPCRMLRRKTIADLKTFLIQNCVKGNKRVAIASKAAHFPRFIFYFAIRLPYIVLLIRGK